MIHYKNNTFYLNTKRTTYCMKVSEDGFLVHCYYGSRIAEEDFSLYNSGFKRSICFAVQCDGKIMSKDELPQEYGSFGRGDNRIPAFKLENDGGRTVGELKYCSYKILNGALKLEKPMPQLSADGDEAMSLVISLKDIVTGINVSLCYTVFEQADIIARHTVVTNNTSKTVYIKRLDSAALDFPAQNYEFITLYGSWGRERWIERYPLHHGISGVGSTLGATGHAQSPFAALVTPDTNENRGGVYGFSLIYSGDFHIQAQVGQFDTARVTLGINPENFSWTLKPGADFCTPQAVMTYSSGGLNGMSANFHSMCRKHLGACARPDLKRPVVLNLWEAMYFDSSEEKIIDAIRRCKGTGIDAVVLDDGWYARRKDEAACLGDWYVSKDKFPNGLGRVIKECKENGVGLGLWIEPETVNRDSDLYRSHPDWCISLPDITPLESRCELVLDYGREDVVNGMYDILSTLLSENDVCYVKWDMNRNISDNGSLFLGKREQGEQNHRYILGVYSLMARLTADFPNIFFEGCSGGGGRFDLGILYYFPQIWTSDDTDAYERTKIQYGTSLVYPPEVMASHITICPNHQTGRITPFKSRNDVAALFSFGYELDLSKLTEAEMNEIPAQVKNHRWLEQRLANGRFYRIDSPFEGNRATWQIVSPDRKFSAVMSMSVLNVPNNHICRIRFLGLNPDLDYRVEPYNVITSGSALMNIGLPLEEQTADFKTEFITAEAIDVTE